MCWFGVTVAEVASCLASPAEIAPTIMGRTNYFVAHPEGRLRVTAIAEEADIVVITVNS